MICINKSQRYLIIQQYKYLKPLNKVFSENNSCSPCFPWPDSPKDPSRRVEDDTIILTDVQTGSSAVYQCNVSNDYGYLLSNAFVNVLCKFITQDPFWLEHRVFHLHWFLKSNNTAINAAAPPQPSRPECWHQHTKSTRSSKTTGPW